MGGNGKAGWEQAWNRMVGGRKIKPLVGDVPGYGYDYEEGTEDGGGRTNMRG